MGSHSLLQQGIFPTQGLNPGLPLCMWILYHLSHQGSPIYCKSYFSEIKFSWVSCIITGKPTRNGAHIKSHWIYFQCTDVPWIKSWNSWPVSVCLAIAPPFLFTWFAPSLIDSLSCCTDFAFTQISEIWI